MRITPNTRIGRLLEEHPEAEEVMAWYGIDLEEFRPSLSLEGLCRYARLEVEDVVADLIAAIEVDDDPDWDDEDEGDDEDRSGDLEDEDEDDGSAWEDDAELDDDPDWEDPDDDDDDAADDDDDDGVEMDFDGDDMLN